MLKLIRLNNFKSQKFIAPLTRQSVIYFSDEKSQDEKKEEKSKKIEKTAENPSKNRLNDLLTSLAKMDSTVTTKSKVDISKIGVAGKKKKSKKESAKQEKKQDSDSDSEDEKPKNVVEAAKSIAKKIGGDVIQTEAELLSKLLGGDGSDSAKKDLNNLIGGMKVDKERGLSGKSSDQKSLNRAQYVKRSIEDSAERMTGQRKDFRRKSEWLSKIASSASGSVDLFGGEPLGIFKNAELIEKEDPLKTWRELEKRELRLAVTHPPSNYFDKMALWTDQGKVWKFPIDNEQGMDEEMKVDFSDHIFLEQHLEGWCPTRGPVRHFMELVCVGLSKNCYLSAREKKDHILWYKSYFEEKKELLSELIVDKDAPGSQPKVTG